MPDLRITIMALENGVMAAENACNSPRVMMETQDIKNAVCLLNKQEPKTVIDCADAFDGILVGRCPNCDESIVNNIEKETHFCKFCGQAVKWSG